MVHRPWSFTDRLVAKMADSSLNDDPSTVGSLLRPPRSGGIHASTLLRKLHPPKKGNGISPEELAIYGLMGLAFEDRCERALMALSEEDDWPWVCFRCDELHHEGIACSPDLLLIPKMGGPTRELSIKVTWKSCRRLPVDREGVDEFDLKDWGYYIHQCMTYATPLNSLSSVLFACFICGDYTGPKTPRIYGWELDYSEDERAEVWCAMQTLKREEEEKAA